MEKKILSPGVKIIDIKWVVPYRGKIFFKIICVNKFVESYEVNAAIW